MLDLDLKKLLADSADEVLSTMFFSMLDPPEPSEEDAPCTRVRVTFEGHATGTLTLTASPDAVAEMTANFLGLDSDPPPPEAEQEAVIKELANIICGAILSRLESSDVLHLLPPELLPEPEVTLGAPESAVAEQRFGLGAGFLNLRFQWDGAI